MWILPSEKSWQWPGDRKVKGSPILHSNPCSVSRVLVEACFQTRKLNQIPGRPYSDREQEMHITTQLSHDHQDSETKSVLKIPMIKHTELLYHLAIVIFILWSLLTRQSLPTHLIPKKNFQGCPQSLCPQISMLTKTLLPGKWLKLSLGRVWDAQEGPQSLAHCLSGTKYDADRDVFLEEIIM